jgi:hypothetical protein
LALENGTIIASNLTTPYLLYQNEHPFFREFNDRMWTESNFSNRDWTETNYMDPEQVQIMQANEYSDDIWDITDDNRETLES